MRILLLTHAFNGLAQRLFVELREAGHTVSVELDIADSVTEEAVHLFRPDLVLAPFLKRAIPPAVWRHCRCWVIHPGPPGDRGPSALDHAVLEGARDWGVTVLQATGEFDAGPVVAWQPLRLRVGATKASLYRHEVTQAACQAVHAALAGDPLPPLPAARGWRPLVRRDERIVDATRHDADEVLRRIRSADGFPGAGGSLFGEACRLFDAHPGPPARGAPGQVLARRGPALLLACRRGTVWVGHVRRGDEGLKLAATTALAEACAPLPEWPAPLQREVHDWDELRYTEPAPGVGWLEFDFHNGAMSERQSRRLVQALRDLRQRPQRVLVLAGGADFFSNGIHLHDIEAAATRAGDSPAQASMRAIEAIDDVALEILTLTDRLTVSALRGNAGAGGCFLALAADAVWAHGGVVLNPHYRNMGNLYGSEYWTYTLPRRVGDERAAALMQGRLPMGATQALREGLLDAVLGEGGAGFEARVRQQAAALADAPDWSDRVAAKRRTRAADEARRPLAAYRADELEQLHRNFNGFDPSYHVARHHFVHRKSHARTPRHLALHRHAAR